MKILKYIGITLLISGALFAAAYFIKTNDKSAIVYETKTIITTSIEKKTVITGKVIPEDEVEIKPQIQGIIDALFVEEGGWITAPSRRSTGGFSCSRSKLYRSTPPRLTCS
jgi:HlyD family secretion protein